MPHPVIAELLEVLNRAADVEGEGAIQMGVATVGSVRSVWLRRADTVRERGTEVPGLEEFADNLRRLDDEAGIRTFSLLAADRWFRLDVGDPGEQFVGCMSGVRSVRPQGPRADGGANPAAR